MNSFVYKWTDTLTGKMYIGVHKGTINDGYVCSSRYMLDEYQKRPTDFIREILEYGTFESCIAKESMLLCEVNAAGNTHYYNQSNGDGKFFHIGPHTTETKRKIIEKKTGVPLSKEHKKKLSEIRRGKPKSEKHKQSIQKALIGHSVSDECREKLARYRKGRMLSTETKNKLSESLSGKNNPMFGRKHSPETIEKMKKNRSRKNNDG